MTDRRRTVPEEVESRLLKRYVRPYALFLLGMWVLLVIYLLFGRTDTRVEMMIFGGVMTVILVGYSVIRMRRGLYMATRGVEVLGQIVTIGKMNGFGRQKIGCQYELNGRLRRAATNVAPKELKGMREGSLIRLIADPARPTLCIPASDLRPEAALPPDASGAPAAGTSHSVGFPADMPHDGLARPQSRRPEIYESPLASRTPVGSAETTKLPDYLAKIKPKEDSDTRLGKTWGRILFGGVVSILAIAEYHRLTKWEAEGGWTTMWRLEGFFYDLFGKWGAVGCIAGVGMLFVGWGVWGLHNPPKKS